jgi:hypothetical protein
VDPEKSLFRPLTAVVAAWSQLAVAGLLVVLVVVNAFGLQLILGTPLTDAPISLLDAGPPLTLAAWLAVTSFGQRRGSRLAYRLSLAGLALPLLLGAGAAVLGVSTTHESFNGIMLRDDLDATALASRLTAWELLSTVVNGAAALTALALTVLALGLLLTRPTRRFFAHAVRNAR